MPQTELNFRYEVGWVSYSNISQWKEAKLERQNAKRKKMRKEKQSKSNAKLNAQVQHPNGRVQITKNWAGKKRNMQDANRHGHAMSKCRGVSLAK
jgi:hypothetical protein